MSRKRYTPEQIIGMLREAEVSLSQGQTVGQVCRTLGVSEQSYYRWRKEYGGLKIDQAKRLKDLEKENGRLRRAVSDLTLDKIQDSFASPETMSFWQLPGFIKILEKAGFTGHRHKLYWHSLLASPMLMVAMVLVAAIFALRQSGRAGAAWSISGAVLCGFLLYFISDLVYALGLSASIPVILAAWTPAGVSTLLGLSALFHIEDG